jgi:hypothetical protein
MHGGDGAERIISPSPGQPRSKGDHKFAVQFPHNYVELENEKRPILPAFGASTPHNLELHIKP